MVFTVNFFFTVKKRCFSDNFQNSRKVLPLKLTFEQPGNLNTKNMCLQLKWILRSACDLVKCLKFHLFQYSLKLNLQLKLFFSLSPHFYEETCKWWFVVLYLIWYSCSFLINNPTSSNLFALLLAIILWYPFRTSAFFFVFFPRMISLLNLLLVSRFPVMGKDFKLLKKNFYWSEVL